MKPLKILIFSMTHNNADIIGFFLRHYSTFADEISVFDDHSTDGTRQLLSANPKVIMRDWPHGTGIDEPLFLAHWREWYPKARGAFDWVFLVDSDEFIVHPNIRALLEVHQNHGTEVLQPEGHNMTCEGVPKDDGRQIYEIAPMGVRAPVYSKPVVFRPHIDINWNLGKHALEGCNPVVKTDPKLKLCHFRYLGAAYTRAKNAKNYARCGLANGDKGAAWSCSPAYDGWDKEHSPAWSEFAKTKAFNVMEV